MVALSEKENYNNCIVGSILHNSWDRGNMRFAPIEMNCFNVIFLNSKI